MEKKQKTLGNKGFSLVELIIVIAIMAVLVVVLAPQFIKFVEKGRESTDLQNVTEIKTAVETYAADRALAGEVPITITITGGTTKTIAVANSSDTNFATRMAEYGVDVNSTLQSESWDNITYTYNGSGSAYQWTNNATGGDDDNAGATYYCWSGKEK